MGKHSLAGPRTTYTALQMAMATSNPKKLRYKQGMLDALVVVSRLQEEKVPVEQAQQLLDGLPNQWDQSVGRAYVAGFEDMFGFIAELLHTEYAPEAALHTQAAPTTLQVPRVSKKTPRKPGLLSKGRR